MSLFCLLILSLLSFALPQDTTSPRYYNPFSSTYHFWSPITDLPANSKIIPLYLTADNNIDLVVGAPNSKIQWYDNIRNVGGNFTLLPITTRPAAEFTNVDFQESGASDIAFIEQNRKQMYVAKNPFRTGLILFQTQKSNDDQNWDEQLIFDLTNNTEIDSSLKSNRIISSMLKVNIDNNDNLDIHQDFILSVEDASHSQNSYIVMLKRNEEEGNYHVNRSFPIPTSKALKIVSYVDLNGDNVFDIVVVIDSKLNVLLSTTEQLVWELKLVSDISFPENYNFKHTTWVDLQGANLKSIFLIHPQTRQLGVLVNTWDGKSYPQWQFTEIVHYSLQTKDSQQTDVNDCVVLFPEYNRRIADFLCITNTDLQYYIQDDTKANITVNSNPPLTIETNIFHDMPLHLLVWNETIKNDHIFYLEPGDTSAFILYSSTQGTLSWVEKNKLELDTYGWTTNFWILIMIYCLFMSMIAGIVHSLVTGRYLIYKRDGALLDKRSPNNAGPANQFHLSFGPNRRTTV